jgi:hypothetical protein
VVSSGLVTRFASLWSAEVRERTSAAERLAAIGQASRGPQRGGMASWTQVQKRDRRDPRGGWFDHPPIVGFGPNAADPHYEPIAGRDRP